MKSSKIEDPGPRNLLSKLKNLDDSIHMKNAKKICLQFCATQDCIKRQKSTKFHMNILIEIFQFCKPDSMTRYFIFSTFHRKI